jgi:hypothetical protein
MNARVYQRSLGLALSGLLWALAAHAVDGDDHHNVSSPPSSEFVLFVSAEAHHFTEAASNGELNEDAPLIGDAVFAVNHDRFRLFGEFQLSREEHDLERFQLGYEAAANTVIWIGRFHQPASAWNTEHHHGRYLQTAITRPSIELWEDEDGIIPQHITGIYVDSRRPIGESGGLHLAAGAGLGVTVQRKGLEELNLLDPQTSGRRLSLSGRVAYLPNYIGTSEIGLLAAHNNMTVMDSVTSSLLRATNVEQDVYGAFVNWNNDSWKIQSAIYDLEMKLTEVGSARSEAVVAGYVQVERQLPKNLTVYAREEDSDRANHSLFITINHSDFELRRAILGLRWDFLRNQALTTEVAQGQRIGSHNSEYRLQWSAAVQ